MFYILYKNNYLIFKVIVSLNFNFVLIANFLDYTFVNMIHSFDYVHKMYPDENTVNLKRLLISSFIGSVVYKTTLIKYSVEYLTKPLAKSNFINLIKIFVTILKYYPVYDIQQR